MSVEPLNIRRAGHFLARLRGLLGTAALAPGHALLITPCAAVHTAFMRYPIDVVFIDADKVNYERYGTWALANLRPGGLVLGDNAFLFGELLDDSDRGRAMRAFHQLVANHCDSVNIPTPDGLVLGIKRGS
ncbi:MAG TPA: hypothetical protein DCY18_06790 [Thauera sp.]|nr:hypothetical protein [Thauera sp.]